MTAEQLAAQIGVRVDTLQAALKGEPIRQRDMERIERWLSPTEPPAQQPDDDSDSIVIEPDIGPPPRFGR
jgi:hypothetical protein